MPSERVLPGVLAALTLVLLASGCEPATSRPAPAAPEAAGVVPSAPKRLVVALKEEPSTLVMTLVPGANIRARPVRLAVYQRIAIYDDRGALFPQLVAELPSIEAGTWIVRPDGTMRTLYRLRPGVTWHDGTPLTVRDVIFGWTVTKDPDLPVNQRGVAVDIGAVETTDDLTFALEWSSTNPGANAIVEDGIGPLPAHLLEAVYQADKQRFQDSAYWSTEFVGVGPYRLAGWEPGSRIVLQAYDGFYAGRAKIDTLEFRFIPSAPTVVANLLAGAIDGAIPPALDLEQALLVEREWEQAGRKGALITQPVSARVGTMQFRDPRPHGARDVRFRQALLHLLDRQVLVEGLAAGQSQIADSIIPPDDVKWTEVRDVVTRYPYDPRRAAALLGELGWRRGADGRFVDAAGDPLGIGAWTAPGGGTERLLNTVAGLWRQEGVAVDETILTAGQYQDNRTRATFPTVLLGDLPIGAELTLVRYISANCPTEETRWGGANWGCFQNPAFDRAVEGIRTAIDPAEQRRLNREFARIQSEDLPYLPLFYAVDATLYRPGVTGVKGETRPRISSTWNVAEWDIRT